jgi:pseudouridine synthase
MERLQKILAHAGIASRRKAEEMITAGRVSVNGKIVTELGTKVDSVRDEIQVDGRKIRVEKLVYIILHKPKGYLSDIDEGRGKPLALDLVPFHERLYPAGRLDANSEGLLLLTNDGELAHRVTHPRYEHEKEYLALVEGEPGDEVFKKLGKGIWYDREMLHADRAGRAGKHQRFGNAHPGQSWVKIVLHEGKKRQVRHMCAAVGHPVLRLIRTRIGGIELGSLPTGQWRALTPTQVNELKRANGKSKVEVKHPKSELGHRD